MLQRQLQILKLENWLEISMSGKKQTIEKLGNYRVEQSIVISDFSKFNFVQKY